MIFKYYQPRIKNRGKKNLDNLEIEGEAVFLQLDAGAHSQEKDASNPPRGLGHLKIIRTIQRGRPRKKYHYSKERIDEEDEDNPDEVA